MGMTNTTELRQMENRLREELVRVACRLRLTEARQALLAETSEAAEEEVREGSLTEAECDRILLLPEKIRLLVDRLEERAKALKTAISALEAVRELADTARSDRKTNEWYAKHPGTPRALPELLRAYPIKR